jgi:hypothetical protein
MHNPRNYESNTEVKKGIIQASELVAINYLQPGQNDELFNKLKHGARLGATMLFQMAQEHDLSSTEVLDYNKATIVISKSKKLKR